jgi:protein-S-isoprenylcysteine O-methyltransferase Ste14
MTGDIMPNTALDRPPVAVFPPVIPFSALAIACGLQWLTPLGLIANIDQGWRIAFGAIIVIAGLLTTVTGRRALVRHGTNVNPLKPSTALVTDGAYRWTRNPLYVGMLAGLCGIAFIFSLDWLLLLLIPSFAIMHFAVVKREEQYLEQKFGDEHRRYKARVPRYVLAF